MSLTLSLNNALSGLKANQQSLAVLSHNIANANTEGYSRQLVDQSAVYIAGVGSGVKVDDVIRKVDKYLQRAVQTQGSEVARTGAVSDYYERIQVLLGEPGATNTVDEYMTGFFNAVQQLSESPERTSARSNMISAATSLATSVSELSYNLQDLRFEADRDINDAVDSVNQLLRKLDGINVAITTAASGKQSTAGLQDQRDAALRDLAGYLDIQVSFDQNGAVNVIAGDGIGLVDGTRHELRYTPIQAAQNFISDDPLNALTVVTLDTSGNPIGNSPALFSSGTSGNITTQLTSGKLEGLRLMRDEMIPAFLDQLDQLASNLRDSMNTIHNDGSGFPPPSSLTGTRGVYASQTTTWVGNVRIAVLNADGTPVPSGYADENYTGMRPLVLNLATLNSGDGDGTPSMQSIINEINDHFSAPTVKTKLGNLNNIELVSDNTAITNGGLFNFDFDLENISNQSASFFATGIQVLDATGTDITNVTNGPPSIALDPADAYYTTAGITDVTINLLTTPTVSVGDTIYLGPPGAANVNGIPAADVTGYFQVIAVAGNSVTFQARSAAAATGDVADASGVSMYEPLDTLQTIPAGAQTRTRNLSDELQVDLNGNASSAYYDIVLNIGVVDEDGNLSTSQITYRIQNNQENLMNHRYQSTDATDDGVRVQPQTTQDALRAILVDENGNEIKKINGQYDDYYPSYLKLYSPNGSYTVAIDEMDSREAGDASIVPPNPGTQWGFSHYFGLNDFFAPNELTDTGDTTRNSALNLRVSQRLIDNPNLVSTGKLVQQNQPADPNTPPQWTYVRYSGDNQIAQQLSTLSTTNVDFDAAGGLPAIGLTFLGYTSEMLGFIASKSASASDEADNAQTLYDGFKTRADAISGVNLDEELANTVIFQNSYSATARIVTVVDKMFEEILNMV